MDDYALEATIDRAAAEEDECDFCRSSPAAELNVLIAAFMEGLRTEYGDADDEGVAYDGSEGGYVWYELWDSWDLVSEHGDVLAGDGVLEAVWGAIEQRIWFDATSHGHAATKR